jgi:RNA methyltransferase, TrmH family
VAAAIKLHRHVGRRRAASFLAEGPNLVEAALRRGLVSEVFATESAMNRFGGMLADAPVHLVTERAAKALSDTVTPVGLVAVCSVPEATLDNVLAVSPRLVAVAVEISEPGNAGTLIRVADALGADAVVLAGHSVDPYNGKCLRASAGSIFSIPVVSETDAAQALSALVEAGLQVLATTVDGEVSLDSLAVRARGARAGCRIGGHGHPSRAHPDGGQRREPQCGVGRVDLPVPERPRTQKELTMCPALSDT